VTDTTPDIVPVAPRAKWWGWSLAVLGLALLVVIAVSSLLPSTIAAEKVNARTGEVEPTPYAQTPASAEPVDERIFFGDLPDDVERFEPEGSFYFVTVTAPTQSLLSWFVGKDDAAIDFLTEEDKFGSRTPTQRREFNLQAMRTAEQEAQYLALTTVGYDAEISEGEVIVQEILCKEVAADGSCGEEFPSGEQIDPADKVLEVDGVPVQSVTDLSRELSGKEPGDTITMLIERPDAGEMTVVVELSESPDDPNRTIIGFIPFDTQVVTLPFEVDIETNQIGGPSAGLAFTLSLIDELTEGDLTGGRNIAVTGTIALDGSVGAIGGLYQKTNAVQQNGIDVFLVPASQHELSDPETLQRLDDAARGQVEIIPVATLEEALEALEELGGDPLVRVDQ
jgi:PDZ domain-containing protein